MHPASKESFVEPALWVSWRHMGDCKVQGAKFAADLALLNMARYGKKMQKGNMRWTSSFMLHLDSVGS